MKLQKRWILLRVFFAKLPVSFECFFVSNNLWPQVFYSRYKAQTHFSPWSNRIILDKFFVVAVNIQNICKKNCHHLKLIHTHKYSQTVNSSDCTTVTTTKIIGLHRMCMVMVYLNITNQCGKNILRETFEFWAGLVGYIFEMM